MKKFRIKNILHTFVIAYDSFIENVILKNFILFYALLN